MELLDGKAQEYEDYKAKNTDPYGGCVVRFGELWADKMEAALAEGKKLEDVADALSHEASKECGGITGFMFGCGVQALAWFWKHGEQLRKWHNLDSQIRDEGEKANESGGVLNPAILNIGT